MPGARPKVRSASKQEHERDGREAERDGSDDGDAVEVPLDDSGRRGGRPETAAEHVGQAAAFAAVEQHEEDQHEGRYDLHDDNEGGEHAPQGTARLPLQNVSVLQGNA